METEDTMIVVDQNITHSSEITPAPGVGYPPWGLPPAPEVPPLGSPLAPEVSLPHPWGLPSTPGVPPPLGSPPSPWGLPH